MKRVIRSSIFASTSMNPRRPEYYQYLNWHISNVQKAWHDMLKPALADKGYDPNDMMKVDICVRDHDMSKYDEDEFIPYCNHFYPTDGFENDEKAFDLAWLRHIHMNPHHHQHWLLHRDSGAIVSLDMPFEYVCEMLCDWHSFSSKDPESTAYAWYQKNKSNMKFSSDTKKLVEELLEYLKEPLPQVQEVV